MISEQVRLNEQAQIKINCGKSDSFTNGEISGYAALWDVQDLDGDVIRKGAFARSINNQINAGKVMLMARHFRDGGDAMEVVGKIVEAREDNVGFWVRCKLSGSGVAQKVRDDVILAPEAYGMSVGWKNVENGYAPLAGGKGFEYTEMNLKEVTITLRPAQEDTVGTVKAKSELAVEERLARIEAALEQLNHKDAAQDSEDAGLAVEDKSEDAETTVDEDDLVDIEHLKRIVNMVKRSRERSNNEG